MTRFIKLTNFLLNTNFISTIIIENNKYTINIVDKSIKGDIWMIWASGGGNMISTQTIVEVCKTKHPNDYKIVSDFINVYQKKIKN
jgi:hypothetical protein